MNMFPLLSSIAESGSLELLYILSTMNEWLTGISKLSVLTTSDIVRTLWWTFVNQEKKTK